MTSWNGNLDETSYEGVKKLLLGHRVVRVEGDTMALDNGAVLCIIPNEGCGGCDNGWYHLEALNEVNNAITNVEMVDLRFILSRLNGIRSHLTRSLNSQRHATIAERR